MTQKPMAQKPMAQRPPEAAKRPRPGAALRPPGAPQEPPKEPHNAPRELQGAPRSRPEGLKSSLAADEEVLCKAMKLLEHPTILWTKLVQACGPGPVLRRPCANFYMWVSTATIMKY